MSDEDKPRRLVVQVYVENFNGNSGAAVVVREIADGKFIDDQAIDVAREAAVLAITGWKSRRRIPR